MRSGAGGTPAVPGESCHSSVGSFLGAEMPREKLHHFTIRVRTLVAMTDDALDSQRIHLLLQPQSKVDVMDSDSVLGVGGQLAGLGVERVNGRVVAREVVDRRSRFIARIRLRRVAFRRRDAEKPFER